jgi:hypothetical protein
MQKNSLALDPFQLSLPMGRVKSLMDLRKGPGSCGVAGWVFPYELRHKSPGGWLSILSARIAAFCLSKRPAGHNNAAGRITTIHLPPWLERGKIVIIYGNRYSI